MENGYLSDTGTVTRWKKILEVRNHSHPWIRYGAKQLSLQLLEYDHFIKDIHMIKNIITWYSLDHNFVSNIIKQKDITDDLLQNILEKIKEGTDKIALMSILELLIHKKISDKTLEKYIFCLNTKYISMRSPIKETLADYIARNEIYNKFSLPTLIILIDKDRRVKRIDNQEAITPLEEKLIGNWNSIDVVFTKPPTAGLNLSPFFKNKIERICHFVL